MIYKMALLNNTEKSHWNGFGPIWQHNMTVLKTLPLHILPLAFFPLSQITTETCHMQYVLCLPLTEM